MLTNVCENRYHTPVLAKSSAGSETPMEIEATQPPSRGFFVSATWQLLMSGSCGEPQGSPVCFCRRSFSPYGSLTLLKRGARLTKPIRQEACHA